MLIRVAALAELASRITAVPTSIEARWDLVDDCFHAWADQPNLRAMLREHVHDLGPAQAQQMIDRSRETTTHFAWCLRDRPEEPFTFWLHEYKPQRDWRPGYADSVHNHRYHFCTTIVRGGYLHEQYVAEIDPATRLIAGAELVSSKPYEVGAVGTMRSTDFHRIPVAEDTTMTFLVKSRALTDWSLSFDPNTQVSHRHVPVEARLDELVRRI
jgi:hypothetical protein